MAIFSYNTVMIVSVCLHLSTAVPIIEEIVNSVLSPPPLRSHLGTPRKQGLLSQLPAVEELGNDIIQRSTDAGSGLPGLPKLRSPPPLPQLPPPKLLPRPPLTPAAINSAFGKVLSLVSILGQIDSYLSERARAIIRKLLLIVDDDSITSAPLGY